ncbi:MAG TPA: hypothetical protein VFO16_04635 [Pseudonocardiaceae bacterium]|nr:hypothetical protein [Pseudonocardiaceae bacterium]
MVWFVPDLYRDTASGTLWLLPCLPLVLAADLVAVLESVVAGDHRGARRGTICSGTLWHGRSCEVGRSLEARMVSWSGLPH